MNTWDINILVNGNRCKQYQHNGKTYLEAKNGSEYVIEIKNNFYQRILGVAAVDGLNVLTGETATEEDTGYIIPAYHSEKIKGFRFSDNEWAMFKFGYKYDGKTYAQSKQNGADVNCGVIGIRLFYENVKWEPLYQCKIYNSLDMCNPLPYQSYTTDYKTNVNFTGLNNTQTFFNNTNCNANQQITNFVSYSQEIKPKGFDMGTEWGRKETSKVITVDFDRGFLAHSFDIYYASKESLIEMGIPLTNELQVNLPQSFPKKYATPPKNWVS